MRTQQVFRAKERLDEDMALRAKKMERPPTIED